MSRGPRIVSRLRKLLTPKAATFAVCLGMMLAPLAGISSASADDLGIEVPEFQELFLGETDKSPNDDFLVYGFGENEILLVSITVSGSATPKISLPVTSGLALESGYSSWLNTSQINFTGREEAVNGALNAMTLSSGEILGTATVIVEVSPKINDTAFYDGHLYEFVPGNISYQNARNEARLRTIGDVSGYLVTISSDAEHDFVLSKIQGAYNIWIALSDRAVEGRWVLDPYDGSPEQNTHVWQGGANGSTQNDNYAKWCGGEPNDWGNEDAAVTKWNGGNCWNDLPDWWSSVGGYVTEYDMPPSMVMSDSMTVAIISIPQTTTTTTTTVTPTPVCGPYPNVTVIGSNAGPIWGSGPYTDDSNLNGAAVHAGLINVGETAVLRAINVAYYRSYSGTTRNGITTSDWATGWCGFDLSLLENQTTTTTTTVPPTTTTTIPPTTTTTVYVPPATTTTTVPETTTTVPETTTTVPETTPVPPDPTTTAPPVSTTLPDRPITPSQSPRTTAPTTIDSSVPSTTTIPAPTTLDASSVTAELDSISGSGKLSEEDKEQIVSIVATVLSAGLTDDVAAVLASNEAVLQTINADEAEEIFSAVNADSISSDDASLIVEAVQGAPEEIRETFEDAVDLFHGAFDEYVMVGQTVSVGDRRTIVAVAALTTALGSSVVVAGSSGGPTSGSSATNGASGNNDAARRDDEEEEPNGEIAGDGVEWISNIRIFTYENGVKTLNWKAFFKKFVYGIFNLGWTLSGALIVYLTLSGSLQTIAGIASVIALVMAMYLHMREPE